MTWFVYMLLCADGSLYTGVTTDIKRRIKEHNSGDKGAKYTKARRPVELVYQELCSSRSQAQAREFVVRNLSKTAKHELLGSV